MAAQFLGEFEVPVDEKGRIFLPAELRRNLEPEADDTFVVTIGLDGCLSGHPRNLWDPIRERMLGLPWQDQGVRRYRREKVRLAREVRLDRQGRASIPRKLLDRVGISDRVVVIGALDQLEFWAPEAWQAYLSEPGPTLEEVAATLDL